ncbi:MAG: hypothetical protein ACJAT7_001517 [Psychromonas sp.]|jgi:hypothetical protein|uniref:tetratricopeptide repeat protein n=1 Tax=Psychromonas sp. TaxID=1884585 RepID=UPI0039E29056
MICRYLFAIFLPICALTCSAVALTPSVASGVSHAYQLQQDDKLQEAIAFLESLTAKRNYDKAYVERVLGGFYWQNEQVNKALLSLQLATNSQHLTGELQFDTMRMLADIQLTQNKYQQAIKNYRQVIEHLESMPSNEAEKLALLWQRLAQAHYQNSDWISVISALEKNHSYTDRVTTANLQLRLAAEIALLRWSAALKSTEQLRALQPESARWWQQLVSLNLKAKHAKQALVILQQYQRMGFLLSQQEIKTLAQLYAQQGIPEKAAQHYQTLKDIDSDAQLKSSQAQYWQMAHNWNNATQAWAQAAKIDSKYRWQHIQILIQQKYYQQGLDLLSLIKKKESKHYLAQVQAYYRLGNISLAYAAAAQAHEINPSANSKSWLEYLGTLRAGKHENHD